MTGLRLLLVLLFLYMPQISQAAPDPETIYTAALASAAAYDDKLSKFAMTRLERQGWHLRHFSCQTKLADSQFLLASKRLSNGDGGRTVHILAFRGTEKNMKDIITDLAAELIFFYPSPTRLVTIIYNNKEIAADVLVHRGFQAYAETALSVPVGGQDRPERPLIEELLTDQTTSVIITGHSLGGAAATLYGAMLLERGIPPRQMQVISFGAPPVANLGFSKRYEERLPLLRVVNPYDLVAHLTAPAPDGAKGRPDYVDLLSYIHFGQMMTNPVSIQNELRQHALRIYFDYAARSRLSLAHGNTLVNDHQPVTVDIVNTSRFSGGHSTYMDQAVREIFADLFCSRGIAVTKRTDNPTDVKISVHIDGQQLESSCEGGVSVSVIVRRNADHSVAWVASEHISLQGELSPLAGAIMAADELASQIQVDPRLLSNPVSTFSSN